MKLSRFGEFVFNLLNARRGVKPTPCDVRSATSGCNQVLLDFRMVAERLCSTRSVSRRDDTRK